MRIALAQLNPVVGDISGNVQRVTALLPTLPPDLDLVVFPELFLVGYPPRDLLEKPAFIQKVQEAVSELVRISHQYPHLGLVVGAPVTTGRAVGKGLYNAALLICRGRSRMQAKTLLPSYDVFDETRYFDPAEAVEAIGYKNEVLGITVCEDLWCQSEICSRRLYDLDPLKTVVDQGASLLLNISASPFYAGKEEMRFDLIRTMARKYRVPFLYVNQVGGNDELIFDGRSMAVDAAGEPIAVLAGFEEGVVILDSHQSGEAGAYHPEEQVATIHQALILGLKDYFRKCGFTRAILGLSGGVDSAVTCCLAAEALGRENVLGVIMPSLYSSPGSISDSQQLADNLGVSTRLIPITPIYQAYLETLREPLGIDGIDVSLENIQARIRGNILMAYSNKYGYLVLSTGNKSELAVGYCTLYGDMSGGLAVISDVPKTLVYELARYINRSREIIPREIITKAPSAELRPDQKDQDTLPPYDILDQVLDYYITEGYCWQDIVNRNFDPETVRWIIKSVDRNEYKRRQAAPGLKVTTKAFGMGRRMPIAARYEV